MKNIIKKVYIVPDYQATSNDHWYPWLSRQLKNAGFESKRIMLANPFQPDLEEWQQNLKLHIPHMDEHTFLVAHGLSCISVLNFLQEHYIQQQRKIGGIIMVSAFDTPLVAWSELNKILQAVRLDLRNLPYSYKRAVMLISSNDPYVPAPISLRLAHSLNAKIFEIKKAGHFNKSDGFSEFPQLLDIITQCLANELQNAAGL
ncbi:RBBP9/YdeN family alpha/beta hydrolase [Acinetobacter pecorum]|uniref:Serine hydrolase family protein n=1 Tax=Acinetobacter pecorum TaxID=2762215 RepID=A0ABR8VYM4_9GAMM|nr:alpha/beta hydrolase [Acinetobacter pecorum]MBD8009869.1 serine hydrolase family protein [Acinetobacter pecorum]